MKRSSFLLSIFLGSTLSSPVISPSQQVWTGILSPSRAINWSSAGLPGATPPDANWTQCGSTIAAYGSSGSPSSTSTINTQINGCTAKTYVQLGTGTFYLTGGITLKNQVAVRGMGANQTFLVMYNNGSGSCNGQYTAISLCGDGSYYLNPDNTATWTAGFSQGTTSITLSNSLHIVAGQTIMILDQQDQPYDTGSIWVCSTGHCGGDNGGGARASGTCASSVTPGVGLCTQQQTVLVTACSPSCNSSGSTVLTISPGLYAANWASAHSTGAWWASAVAFQEGAEDMSIDLSNLTDPTSCVTAMNTYQPWVSGIRCIDGGRSHISFWGVSHGLVANNYFYQNLSHATQSYGVELFEGTSDTLVLNNIFQQVTDSSPSNTSGGAGNVGAYNFAVLDIFDGSWFQPSDYEHSGGDFFWLREGNDSLGLEADDIHGTHHFTTLFRNRYPGWQTFGCGSATTSCANPVSNSSAVLMQAGSRYFNVIANVVGQANYHKTYTILAPSSGNSPFNLGEAYTGNGGPNPGFCTTPGSCTSGTGPYTTNNDPLTQSSVVRWGNWDNVTAGCSASLTTCTSTVRFCSAGSGSPCSGDESASSFADATGSPSTFAGLANPSTTFPSSFFLTAATTTSSSPCGTGISWWKNPTTGTCPPFPTTGPDVASGNMLVCSGGTYALSYDIASAKLPCSTGGGTAVTAFGGHANADPAMVCYLAVMGGPPDGTGPVLSFNRASCYGADGSSTQTQPLPPQSVNGVANPVTN